MKPMKYITHNSILAVLTAFHFPIPAFIQAKAAPPTGSGVQVEIVDADGNPIPGFTKADCKKMQGNTIEQEVTWNNASVGTLAGTPMRLKFYMSYADLYSFQFK